MRQRIIGSIAIALAGPALGHHSDAALDIETVITIEGTVSEFSLRNPHSYFVVETTDDAGAPVSWEIQLGSAIGMTRRGWTSDTLLLGDRVIVGLHPARDGRRYGLFESLEKDGEAISYETLPPQGRQASTTSIEGIWIVDRDRLSPDYPGGLNELMSRELVPTDRGRAAYEAFDEDSFENPELSCIGKPTPGGLIYTDLFPIQIELVEDEQLTVIRSQYFDEVRTVYMDGREHPPPDVRTPEGHSIGWWEGDTLVVDTRNFADNRSPYQNGIPSGAQKHVVERYRLLEGGTHLRAEFTLEDPEYLVGTMTHTRDLRYSPQLRLTPFDCDLESTRRYLPR